MSKKKPDPWDGVEKAYIEEMIRFDPSNYCKWHGLEGGIMDLSRVTGVHRRTLNRWYEEKPRLFRIVVRGAESYLRELENVSKMKRVVIDEINNPPAPSGRIQDLHRKYQNLIEDDH